MKFEYKREVLDNGMTIILEKRDLPVVSTAIAVRCGGINESADEKGISHFIEHMLYKGTHKRTAKQIAEEIEKKGGELNGFTAEEITAFWCKMPSKHLEIALDVLSDLVLDPLFDEKELEKERKVIFEEIKMRKDDPGTYSIDQINRVLYSDAFGIPLSGTFETMASLTREKLVSRFKEIYTPKNMILVVVGDIDFKNVLSFAKRKFNSPVSGTVPTFSFEKQQGHIAEKRKGIDQATLVFAYHVPFSNQKESYAAQVLSAIMAEGMSSRLFEEIREKRNLAYAVKGDSILSKDFAYNLIYVGTSKEHLKSVRELIEDEFHKLAKSLTEQELKQAKEQLVGNHFLTMEDSRDQMVHLLLFEINRTIEDFYTFEKHLSKVTLEEVRTLADLSEYSTFSLSPE